MIGTAKLGSYAKRLIEYCYYDKHVSAKMQRKLDAADIRGELVYIQNLGIKLDAEGKLDLGYLTKQFVDNHAKNKQLTKFMWHQSFSFAPGEKPGNEIITKIATEFASAFGFEQNQLLVFKHQDTDNLHFHIVANRINHNGKNTADHFKNYSRTGKFARRMELELGLIQTADMHINKRREKEGATTDTAHIKLKSFIDSLLAGATSIDQLEQQLVAAGYKTYTGRGIAFFNMQKKIKIKGSALGREYSLSSIEKRLAVNDATQAKQQMRSERSEKRKRGRSI